MSNAPDKASTVDCSELDSIRTPSEFHDNQSNSSGLSNDEIGNMIKQRFDPLLKAIEEINRERFEMKARIESLEHKVQYLTEENDILKNKADNLTLNNEYLVDELEKIRVENEHLVKNNKESSSPQLNRPMITKNKILIGPLPQDMTKDDVKRLFERFGKIQQVKRDSENKRNC